MLPTITAKAVKYIEKRAETPDKPFFLFFALTSPHTPWLPGKESLWKSKAGYYGDFVAHTDHVVGQVLKTLESNGLSDDTLIVVTSDNGAHWSPGDIKRFNHRANNFLRGQKADIYEGGHRVPFIAKWPGKIESGSVSSTIATLADLFSTAADITGVNQGPDDGSDGLMV